MPKEDIKNIQEFFPEESSEKSPQQKWDVIFQDWINKVDQKNFTLDLFELKLWFEGLDGFFTSSYLEKLIFKHTVSNLRDYEFYLSTFNQIASKIIVHLKELDFKKDKYLLNFEEFIVESILEGYILKSFPNLRDVYSPESWFYGLRIFLQNLKTVAVELSKGDSVSLRAYTSLKKLYHIELINNPLIISLLKRRFIPKMDKIYQQDISNIIALIRNKTLKKYVGIFFVFAFRIMKINNFIELNLKRSRNISITIPLIIVLKRNLENIFLFYEKFLESSLKNNFKDKKIHAKIDKVFSGLQSEYKKIFEGELPHFFESSEEKINRRTIVKNVIIISGVAIQELIETIAQLFKPEISGSSIFENFVSRKQKSLEVKTKLEKLHNKIEEYLTKKGNVSPADIMFDLNLFIETDLNYLLFKDWNEFLSYYNNLVKINFSTDFDKNIKSFQTFISSILKELGEK
jgi:hypothetical protein